MPGLVPGINVFRLLRKPYPPLEGEGRYAIERSEIRTGVG
jgi:hypothetical protein